jgi:ribonuclease T2
MIKSVFFRLARFNRWRPAGRLATLGLAGLAAAALALVGTHTAVARHHSRYTEASAGNFDYYLLSLSWSPAFCLDSPGSAECNGPRRYGFIVHGLWPENERDRGPEHCDVHERVPDDVVAGLADIMPARGLVYHEWTAHGTCSGLEPGEFFGLVRRAYAHVAMPAEFVQPGQPIQQSTDAILAAFLRANRDLRRDAIFVTCSRQDVPRLRELRICLDRSLAPRACSEDALRGACSAGQLLVPPIR